MTLEQVFASISALPAGWPTSRGAGDLGSLALKRRHGAFPGAKSRTRPSLGGVQGLSVHRPDCGRI